MRTRVLLAGLLAALASGIFGVAAASAYTVSPEGPFTATSTKVVFTAQRFTGGYQTKVVCTSGTIAGQVQNQAANPGAVEGKPAFGGCVSPAEGGSSGLGSATVKQSASTVTGFTVSPTGAAMTNLNLHVTYQGLACNYDLQGNLSFGTARNAAGEVTAFTQPAVPSTLKVANAAPAEAIFCSQYFFRNGQSVTVEELPFTLNHPLKVQ